VQEINIIQLFLIAQDMNGTDNVRVPGRQLCCLSSIFVVSHLKCLVGREIPAGRKSHHALRFTEDAKDRAALKARGRRELKIKALVPLGVPRFQSSSPVPCTFNSALSSTWNVWGPFKIERSWMRTLRVGELTTDFSGSMRRRRNLIFCD
jgi:hypothetical protein